MIEKKNLVDGLQQKEPCWVRTRSDGACTQSSAGVDSEEPWISSCMEMRRSKSARTDLHSKTAKVVSSSRDQANYSRIYVVGMAPLGNGEEIDWSESEFQLYSK